MKKLTDSIVRKIVEIVVPLHLPNYDRQELNLAMWNIVLNFAHYAGFDVTNELLRANNHIKDYSIKLSITPLEENRKALAIMDNTFGDRIHSEEFEAQLAAVMTIE